MCEFFLEKNVEDNGFSWGRLEVVSLTLRSED